MTRPLEDRYLATEPELKDMLAFAMGGRVAEEIVFSEVSTGAQNDLEKATQIARAMVAEYGMSEKIGPQSFGHDDPNAFFGGGAKISGATAQTIDEEVARLLTDAHEHAERLIGTGHRGRHPRKCDEAGNGHGRETRDTDPQPAAKPLPAPHADVHFHARRLRPR
jgi:ATP-dependent Zn protease